MEGQKHKKKEAQIKSGQQPAVAKTKTTYRCDLCGVTCTGQDTYQAHARGAKHQKVSSLNEKFARCFLKREIFFSLDFEITPDVGQTDPEYRTNDHSSSKQNAKG